MLLGCCGCKSGLYCCCCLFFSINVFEFAILGNFVTDFLAHTSDHLADMDRAPSLIVSAAYNGWRDVIP